MSSSRSKSLDKNKVFFGLIHYILSEQKNVNWLIKSSLIDITGVNSMLEEKPYKTDSILEDVVDYITEIKPYHVQFSHYFEHYETAKESVNILKNDWIEPTIGLTFDSIKSTPDINKIFYSIVDNLPSEEKYNINGLTVFNKNDNLFYARFYIQDEITLEWSWVWQQLDEKLSFDGAYYTTLDKKMYKVVLSNGNTNTLEEFTEDDKEKFINAHRANRLFYMKYWNNIKKTWNDGGIKVFDEIKKELNANFKGLEINGSAFDIEKFGYDIFNYDTTDYDSPTIIYDYYFVNDYENDLNQNYSGEHAFSFTDDYDIANTNYYQKSYTTVGEHRFSLGTNYISMSNDPAYETYVYKIHNGVITDYNDYEIQDKKYIDVFTPLTNKEKIYVTLSLKNTENNPIACAYVIESSTFVPSDSEILHREFVSMSEVINGSVVPVNDYSLKIPSTDINSTDKIAVQYKKSNGSRMPFTNFNYSDGYIIIHNYDEQHHTTYFNEYEHIMMTQFDYKYLYDKIYTWEDRYGRSNNIVNLDGDSFLRSRYEEDRPSEKIVSYPQSSFIIKKETYINETSDEKEPRYDLYMNDYKNDMSYTTMYNGVDATLCKDPLKNEDGVITSIYISSINNFQSAPGYAMIDDEILGYKTIIEHPTDDDESDEIYYELTNLSRGMFGTVVNGEQVAKYPPYKITFEAGDKIIPYNPNNWSKKDRNNLYKSYNVKGDTITDYNCPSGYKLYSSLLDNSAENLGERILISKLPKINLINDVTGNSEEIIIDSCNVVTGLVTKNNKKIPIQQALKEEQTEKVYTNQDDYYYLKINDDVVKFKSINKIVDNETYRLSNIILPSKYINYKDKLVYDKNTSFIHSCIPEEIDDYRIKFEEGDFVYNIIDSNEDGIQYVQMTPSNQSLEPVNLYKIIDKSSTDSSTIKEIYVINSLITSDNTITTENLFGTIIDDYVYKTNGDIYAKIEGNKFISVQTIVSIGDDILKTGESLHINVIN